MSRARIAWGLAAGGWLPLIGGCESAESPAPAPEPLAAPLTLEQLRNTEYPSQWPASGLARLKNGVYLEPAAPGSVAEIAVRATSLHAFGDLDGDGATDAVIVLESDPGGSGVFFDLAAALNRGGQPLPLAAVALGDRVQVRSVTIADDGSVQVTLRKHGPNDPLCCPTLDVVLHYRLEGDHLVNEGQEPRRSSASPLNRYTVQSRTPSAPILA
jgi:hypothetical protein